MRRALAAACWIGAIAWIWFSIEWISSRLELWSLGSLVAALCAFMAATFAVFVSARGATMHPSWLRATNFVILAIVTVSGGLLALALILTGGDVPDATLGAVMVWLWVHLPIYSFLPRGTDWRGIAAGTAVQWTVIVALIARVTRGARLSRAIALSAGTILAVAAVMTSSFLILAFKTWFDTP
jgi:hypothetical protein